MQVTDKNYNLENRLIEKLDLMIARTTGDNKDDNVILIDGDEGQGKSNLSAGIAYYVHYKTKRPLTLANVFFDLDELIEFAISTEEQIIDWDEGALGGLAIEWWKKNQIKFLKLLMVCRKKRHFIIICIPKFFKLNEYLVVDRSIALIHVYSRGNITKGRFFYYTKESKEQLYFMWKSTKKRLYKKFRSFGGAFEPYLPLIFNEKEYDKKKDIAILSLGEESKSVEDDKYKELKGKLANLTFPIKSQRQLSLALGFNPTTVQSWKGLGQNPSKMTSLQAENANDDANIDNNGINPSEIVNGEPTEEGQLKKYNPIEVKAG